jgi:K+-transporting ATPase ATPase C chain
LHPAAKQLRPALVSLAVLTAITGVAYPAFSLLVARVAFADRASGSLVEQNGRVVASRLIGQSFTSPGYLHPRPSAAGSGYDGASSGGTNLTPFGEKLVHGAVDDPQTPAVDESFAGIEQLAIAYRHENGLSADAQVPVDAVTCSGSGLDPHVSPANAALQLHRVARARGVSAEEVAAIVASCTEGRTLGVIGDPRVDVVCVNLALDEKMPLGAKTMVPP